MGSGQLVMGAEVVRGHVWSEGGVEGLHATLVHSGLTYCVWMVTHAAHVVVCS